MSADYALLLSETSPRRKILVVTCDLPSHPYAAAKLAKTLAGAGHQVNLASPKGPAFDRIVSETKESANIQCTQVGTVCTQKHMNERSVTNPHSYKTLLEAFKDPYPAAKYICEVHFDNQEGMYEPIKREIETGNYDLVIPIHSSSITVCDAIEAATGGDVPVIIFSAMPYEPFFYLKTDYSTWFMPRSLTTFPHVATYSANPPSNMFQYVVQVFWKLLDGWLTTRAWARSAAYNNERRARRGLGPIPDGWRGYALNYPTICFGGVAPFMDSKSVIAPQVTVVGSLETGTTPQVQVDLKRWLDRDDGGIVYTGFGTGTELSEKEAAAITGDLLRGLSDLKSPPPVLFALRASEQQRLRKIFDRSIGSAPTSQSDTHLEYLNGRLRIEANVPQASLLKSGRVKLFLSHMGMGGFVEGVKGGVPFVAYPSGCDQWFNTQRAVDAGIAVQASYGLDDIGHVVRHALEDEDLAARAREAANKLEKVRGEERVLELVEAVAKKQHVHFAETNRDEELCSRELLVESLSHRRASFPLHFPLNCSSSARTM